MADLPLRDDLVGQVPYGAPQLDVPVQLNVNENPYPPSASLVADLAAAVAEVAGRLNRYPDREALGCCAGPGGLSRQARAGHRRRLPGLGGNGSNEVMLQLMQAFGGPGRTALGFSPTYAMYPDYCRDTFTTWVTEPRADDFSLDTDKAVEAVRRHRADGHDPDLAEQPDRYGTAARDRAGRARGDR